jgi:hypothetical protein
MMEVIATYKTSRQIGPDEYETYTKVVVLDWHMTLSDAFGEIVKDWHKPPPDLDVEMHWKVDDN